MLRVFFFFPVVQSDIELLNNRENREQVAGAPVSLHASLPKEAYIQVLRECCALSFAFWTGYCRHCLAS